MAGIENRWNEPTDKLKIENIWVFEFLWVLFVTFQQSSSFY